MVAICRGSMYSRHDIFGLVQIWLSFVITQNRIPLNGTAEIYTGLSFNRFEHERSEYYYIHWTIVYKPRWMDLWMGSVSVNHNVFIIGWSMNMIVYQLVLSTIKQSFERNSGHSHDPHDARWNAVKLLLSNHMKHTVRLNLQFKYNALE